MNLSLTEESLLTKPQLLEMLHEAWERIKSLEEEVEAGGSYFDGKLDGYDEGYEDGRAATWG